MAKQGREEASLSLSKQAGGLDGQLTQQSRDSISD
jgi:hypothetical protein